MFFPFLVSAAGTRMLKLLIEVPSFSDEGGHTRYKVATAAATEGAAPTVAFRRFSEFEKLHAALGIAVPLPPSRHLTASPNRTATPRHAVHRTGCPSGACWCSARPR